MSRAGGEAPSPGLHRTALTVLRVASALAAVAFARAVLRDPYTMHLHGGEVMQPAPWWHAALALAELALLAAFAASAWRWSARTTLALLLGATLVNLGATLAYVRADGMARFVFGFAQQSFLGTYLALVAARVLLALLWALPWTAVREPRAEGAAPLPAGPG